MRQMSNVIKIEEFVKNKLKDRGEMLAASRLIDNFRKEYGKTEKGFNSTAFIRKIRDTRQ